jgi:uncharacterized protein YjeT (DUF2065 family)
MRISIMKWFLYAVSLLWISAGCCMILYTRETRNVMERFLLQIDRRILSILPFIAGILFMLAASASSNPWFIRFLGLMGVAKGVFIFFNPNNLYDRVNNWYLNSISDQTRRLWGVIALVLGTAVLSWIQ